MKFPDLAQQVVNAPILTSDAPWWQHWIFAGIEPTQESGLRRKLIQLNLAQFVLIAVVCSYNLLFLWTNNEALIRSGLWQLPFMALGGLTWRLNQLGHLGLARWNFFSCVSACVLAAILGGQGLLLHTHVYFLLNAMAVVVLIPPGRAITGWVMVGASLGLFLVCQIVSPPAAAAMQRLPAWLMGTLSAVVYLVMTAGVLAVLAFNESVTRTLEKALHELASTDALTGLPNRRSFHQVLAHALVSGSVTGKPLAVAIIDIDHFKRVNDTHGHDVGDDVLCHVAHSLADNVRTDDFLARLGGEEFGVVIPASAEQAMELAERLRVAIWRSPYRAEDLTLHLSVSLGVAAWDGHVDGGLLLRDADQALYAAKRGGRNAVHFGGAALDSLQNATLHGTDGPQRPHRQSAQ